MNTRASLAVLALYFCGAVCRADDLPSASALANAVSNAFQSKSVTQFLALYCWDKVSDSMRASQESSAADLVTHGAARVTLQPWPEGHPTAHILRGIKYSPNLAPQGMVQIDFADVANAKCMLPYGSGPNGYALVNVVEEPVGGPVVPDNQLSVNIFSSPATNLMSGYFTYSQGSLVQTSMISSSEGGSSLVLGGHVLACELRGSMDNSNAWIRLQLDENGTNIFKSPMHFGLAPLSYQRPAEATPGK